MIHAKDIVRLTFAPALIAIHWLTSSDWPMYPIIGAVWVSFFVLTICIGTMKLLGEPVSMLHLSKSVDALGVKWLAVSMILAGLTLYALWIGNFFITFWIFVLVLLFSQALQAFKRFVNTTAYSNEQE